MASEIGSRAVSLGPMGQVRVGQPRPLQAQRTVTASISATRVYVVSIVWLTAFRLRCARLQGPWLLGRLLHALFPPSLSPSPATPTIYRRIHQLRYLHDQQQQPTQQQQPAHHHAVAQGQAQPSSPESDPAPSPAQQHTPTALRPGHGRRAWHAVATPSACLWQHVRGKATWNGPLDPFMKLKQKGD